MVMTRVQHDGWTSEGEFDYLPLDFVKTFEKQIMHNHSQTVEHLAKRSGLSWRELACAITRRGFDELRDQPEFECKKYVAWYLYKWLRETEWKNDCTVYGFEGEEI